MLFTRRALDAYSTDLRDESQTIRPMPRASYSNFAYLGFQNLEESLSLSLSFSLGVRAERTGSIGRKSRRANRIDSSVRFPVRRSEEEREEEKKVGVS